MANPFMKNGKYNTTVIKSTINALIFVVFFLPIIIVLYLALFNLTFSESQVGALFYMFWIGLVILFIANMPEL